MAEIPSLRSSRLRILICRFPPLLILFILLDLASLVDLSVFSFLICFIYFLFFFISASVWHLQEELAHFGDPIAATQNYRSSPGFCCLQYSSLFDM